MKCKNCEINEAVKYSKYSNGEFCSKKCARAYSTKDKRKNINKKVSINLKKYFKINGHNRLDEKHSDETKNKIGLFQKKLYLEKLKNTPFEKWSKNSKSNYIWNKYDNTCWECGYFYRDDNGKGPFAIHHKDGNHNNWKENNLILLCMNCHWMTENWGFRGRKHSKKSIAKGLKTKYKNGYIKNITENYNF